MQSRSRVEAGAESSSEWIVLVDDLIDELIDKVIDYAEDGRYLAGLVGRFARRLLAACYTLGRLPLDNANV